MADQLLSDLHLLVADAGQRMTLELHRVAPHGAARHRDPSNCLLALLDVMLRPTTLILESHDPIGTVQGW